MAITLPTLGAPAWGSPLNSQLETLAHTGFNANDVGILTWAYDPIQCSASAAPASGTIRLIRMPRVVATQTVTQICLHTATASTGGSAGQNFAGLYTSSGTRVAVTADATTAFSTAGVELLDLTSPYVMSPGVYYVAILVNATTPAEFSLCASTSASTANWGLALENSRFANGPAGQTSLPPTITMTGLTQSPQCTWAGLN